MTESLSLNLMLVEDDKDFAFLLQNHLSNAISTQTWQFTHVTSIKEALSQGLNRYFHAILLDLGLPDSRGLNTLKQILDNYPNTPIVVFSAVQNEDQALKAVQMGAQDYIVKGQVDNAQLGRAIRFAIERHQSRTELQRLAMIDDLTKLYNRRAFNALSEQQMRLADREKKTLLFLLIDMDGLKGINDTHGHNAGDKALQKTARALRHTLRSSDIVARIGGDEFAILAIRAENGGEAIIARIESFVEKTNKEGNPFTLSLSIGLASYSPGDKKTIEDLIQVADKTLYRVKRAKYAKMKQQDK